MTSVPLTKDGFNGHRTGCPGRQCLLIVLKRPLDESVFEVMQRVVFSGSIARTEFPRAIWLITEDFEIVWQKRTFSLLQWR